MWDWKQLVSKLQTTCIRFSLCLRIILFHFHLKSTRPNRHHTSSYRCLYHWLLRDGVMIFLDSPIISFFSKILKNTCFSLKQLKRKSLKSSKKSSLVTKIVTASQIDKLELECCVYYYLTLKNDWKTKSQADRLFVWMLVMIFVFTWWTSKKFITRYKKDSMNHWMFVFHFQQISVWLQTDFCRHSSRITG